jgi:hypothetical protein
MRKRKRLKGKMIIGQVLKVIYRQTRYSKHHVATKIMEELTSKLFYAICLTLKIIKARRLVTQKNIRTNPSTHASQNLRPLSHQAIPLQSTL